MAETAETSADRRHVTLHRDQISFNGTLHLDADLDIADAMDLDVALSERAAVLKNLGCDESLDVRRSLALGDLARTQIGLTFDNADTAGSAPAPAATTRQVVLHVHLTDTAITGNGADLKLARLEEGDRLLLADQVRDWCGRPDTQITVKPVINLADRLATGAYEIPNRIRDHVIARDPTCVFPRCTRNARRCDLDHITPYGRGGPTATDNIAPLCRRHHRLKTHAGWRYRRDPDGNYRWTSPHGLT